MKIYIVFIILILEFPLCSFAAFETKCGQYQAIGKIVYAPGKEPVLVLGEHTNSWAKFPVDIADEKLLLLQSTSKVQTVSGDFTYTLTKIVGDQIARARVDIFSTPTGKQYRNPKPNPILIKESPCL